MKKLVIFGNGKIAEVIHHFFKYESEYEVVAFTADEKYIMDNTFCGLPVVPFETLEQSYSTTEHEAFVAVGYQDMNRLREQKLSEIKAKGYRITSYVHPQSGVPADLVYGENCFIMNNVNVHPVVKLGDNVFVWSGTMIGHHCTVGHHNWFTSSANVSGNVTIGNNCFFAVGATTGHGIELGDACFIGANALVTKSIPSETVIIAESNKPFRLNSQQFMRMSKLMNI